MTTQTTAQPPLAIVGLSCRLPGADDLESYWRLMFEGRSSVGELQEPRFNRELHFDSREGIVGKTYTTLGAIVGDRPSDAAVCRIPEELRKVSNRSQLILCELAAVACRQAGLDPHALPTRNAGVYVGHTPPNATDGRNAIYEARVSETAQYLHEVPAFSQATGGDGAEVIAEVVSRCRYGQREYVPSRKRANASHAAALISEVFGLNGPAMSFDAACASSLRALAQAGRALQLGEIDLAIAASGSFCSVEALMLFSAARSVSRHGSRPFDDDADGLVTAEGFVVVVMQRLEDAIAAGHPILAVVRGIGISSDGRGKSLWAPRKEGQIEAIRRAYGDGVGMDKVQFVEAHATSTQVGDATELAALTEVLSGHLPASAKIPLGSVKANVGHTLETAGMAGLVKTVLAIQHRVIPPQINVRRLNSQIDWDKVPFYVPMRPVTWPEQPDHSPRRAAVNAFGIGGLNIHVVVDEYLPGVDYGLGPGTRGGDGETGRRGDEAIILPVSPSPSLPLSSSSKERATSKLPQGGSSLDSPRFQQDFAPHEPVAIVGRGAVLPGARTIMQFWDLLHSGRDQRTMAPRARWQTAAQAAGDDLARRLPTQLGGFITDFEYDWKRHKVPPKQLATADPLQFMLLDAAEQALREAGCFDKPFDRKLTGVVFGTIFGSDFGHDLQLGLRLADFKRALEHTLRLRGVAADRIAAIYDQFAKLLLARMPAVVDETGSFIASSAASRITKTFDLMGGAVAVDAGEASGMAALQLCVHLLRARDCQLMVCAAGQRALSKLTYQGLSQFGLLTQGNPHAPFDAGADGLVPGEGAAVVVLKRLSDALRDGDRVYGVIHGIGAARADRLDESIELAIRRAWAASGIPAEDISTLSAGSSGVRSQDRDEITALARTYGAGRRSAPLVVGSLAGQIGNTAGASGVATLLKTVDELEHREAHPTVGLVEPLATASAGLELLRGEPRRLSPTAEARLFGAATSFSDYSLAYHVIVERGMAVSIATAGVQREFMGTCGVAELARVRESGDARVREGVDGPNSGEFSYGSDSSPRPAPPVDSPLARSGSAWRLIRLSAHSLADLTALAGRNDEAAALWSRESNRFYDSQHRVRLAIVAQSAEELDQHLKLVTRQGAKPEAHAPLADRGIFIGPVLMETAASCRPRVAFAFPGQGSQYGGMLQSLVHDCPPAAAAMARLDAVLQSQRLPTFAEMAWKPDKELDTALLPAQLMILTADLILWAALESLGVRPDRVCGHSLGEIAALVAAGAWTFEQAVKATIARTQAVSGCSGGSLFSSRAPAELIHKLIPEVGGRIYLSHQNAPDQTVVGGEEDAVIRMAQALKANRYPGRMLRVHAPFHTPLMAPALPMYRKALEPLTLRPPMIPYLTTVTNRFTSDIDELFENLVAMLIKPIDYVRVIDHMIAAETSVLIEVGPRQVLTGLHRSILGNRNVVLLAADHQRRSGLQQMLCLQAALEVAGVLEPLDCRTYPSFDFASELPPGQLPNAGAVAPAPAWPGLERSEAPAGEETDAPARYGKPLAIVTEVQTPTTISDVALAGSPPGLPFGPAPATRPPCAPEPRERGRQRGQERRDSIRQALRLQAARAGGQSDALAEFLASGKVVASLYSPAQLEELRGVAEGAGVAASNLLALVARLQFSSADAQMQLNPDELLDKHFNERACAQSPATPTRSASEAVDPRPRLQSGLVENASNLAADSRQAVAGNYAPPGPATPLPEISGTGTAASASGEESTFSTDTPLLSFEVARTSETRGGDWETGRLGDWTAGRRVSPSPGIPLSSPPDKRATSKLPRGGNLSADICNRFVIRMHESPRTVSPDKAMDLSGRAIVLGQNAVGEALCRELRRRGVSADLLIEGDRAVVIQDLEGLWNAAPAPNLFITTAWDKDAGTNLSALEWDTRRREGVLLPYAVCQRWYQLVLASNLLDRASVTAAVNLGGDFGLSGRPGSFEGGALAGLLKGLRTEVAAHSQISLRTKLLDAPAATAPELIAERLCDELVDSSDEVEVAIRGDARFAARIVPAAVPAPASHPAPAGVWVVTGGARGISAVVARELGKRYRLTLHLIGSSPAPPVPDAWRELSPSELQELKVIVSKEALANGEAPAAAWARFEKQLEIDRNLRRFEADGVKAVYHQCDVSNRALLARVLDKIRKAGSPITGLLHGAGFESAARFEKRKLALVEQTFAAKTDGMAALLELTRDDPLTHVIAFGSISARFGAVGQTDYCAANDMLGKMVAAVRHTRSGCRATTFYWHAWGEVGMAARPESRKFLEAAKLHFLPLGPKNRHFLDEVAAGLPEPEVVITESTLVDRHIRGPSASSTGHPLKIEPRPSGSGPAREKNDETPLPHGRGSGTMSLEPAVTQYPLITGLTSPSPDRFVAELLLDPARDPFLVQHRFRGRPMLPVVVAIDALCQAVQKFAGETRCVVAVRNVETVNGLRFFTDDVHVARVHGHLRGNVVACELTADFSNSKGKLIQTDRVCLRGTVEVANEAKSLELHAPELPSEWNDVGYAGEDFLIYHGPIFRCLTQMKYVPPGTWINFKAPPLAEFAGSCGTSGWLLPDQLLDACFFACGVCLWYDSGFVSIPYNLESLMLVRCPRPDETCRAFIVQLPREGQNAVFNFTLVDAENRVLIQVEGFRTIIVNQGAESVH